MDAKSTVMAMAALGMFDTPIRGAAPPPAKKCQLPECAANAAPGKRFCTKKCFGEYEKRRRAALGRARQPEPIFTESRRDKDKRLEDSPQ